MQNEVDKMLTFCSSTLLVTVLALSTVRGMLRHPLQLSPSFFKERVRYSNDWAVEVNGGVLVANQLAARHGFINMGQIGTFEDHYHFQLLLNTTSLSAAGSAYVKSPNYNHISDRTIGSLAEIGLQSALSDNLKSEGMVGHVEQQRLRRHNKREFMHPSDPKFSREWSLINAGQVNSPAGLDLNVERAWMQGYTGVGVVVGFVDDGLEHTHPDLRDNYDPTASYDFVHSDGDPTPTEYEGEEPDRHGTSCAGEVGMSKDNNNCGVGVAYGCKIGGLKLDLGSSSDVKESNALSYVRDYIHVYSNSWGPSDYGFTVEGPGSYLARTFQQGVLQGRNGLGSIFIWAAGNGGTYYDSCTADGFASSIYTIAVGSADQSGKQADYDEFCSSKMAVTFSYDSRSFPSEDDKWNAYNQVTTTTLNGRCTDDFTGTSASTPLVSGVAALTLQANPSLTWRDMQYLIVYTSDTSRLVDGDWQTNGAGLKVSHKFGFGAIDAEAMVHRAKKWRTVPTQIIYPVYPDQASSYDISSSWTTTFTVTQFTPITYLEHVVVNMTLTIGGYSRGYDTSDFQYEIDYHHFATTDELYKWLEDPHPRRGDIKIQLTSPQGTVSTLLPYRNYDFINEEGYSDWPFMSVQHWGENPVGTWSLTITYRSSSGYVRARGISLNLHGTRSVPVSVSSIPSACHPNCSRGCSGPKSSDCDGCREYRVASTLECVSECPNTTYAHNMYCLTGARQPDHDSIYVYTETYPPNNVTTSDQMAHDESNGNVGRVITTVLPPTGPKNFHPSIGFVAGVSVAGLVILLVVVGLVVGLSVKYQASKRSRSRRFHYSPIARSPTAV